MRFLALTLLVLTGATACESTKRGPPPAAELERIRDRTNTNASAGANDRSSLQPIDPDKVRQRTNTNVNNPKAQ